MMIILNHWVVTWIRPPISVRHFIMTSLFLESRIYLLNCVSLIGANRLASCSPSDLMIAVDSVVHSDYKKLFWQTPNILIQSQSTLHTLTMQSPYCLGVYDEVVIVRITMIEIRIDFIIYYYNIVVCSGCMMRYKIWLVK